MKISAFFDKEIDAKDLDTRFSAVNIQSRMRAYGDGAWVIANWHGLSHVELTSGRVQVKLKKTRLAPVLFTFFPAVIVTEG
jgi:hypothetical protein